MEKIKTVHGEFVSEKVTNKYKNRVKWTPNNPKQIKSFIPGTIVEIFVKEGDKVPMGSKLISFNAMKMLNLMESEFEAVVKKISVSPGDTVAKGVVMIEFE